jgi:hypothetical protein
MKARTTMRERLLAIARGAWRTAVGTATVAAVAVAWSLASSTPERADGAGAPATGGWGSEAIADVRDMMRAVSPIAEANACGMGASSCFKCHNGTRAAAPGDAKWHSDHKSVDNSCAGCHKGNPRLIKKELAHAELVKDPRAKVSDQCASCHKSGNAADLAKAYTKK